MPSKLIIKLIFLRTLFPLTPAPFAVFSVRYILFLMFTSPLTSITNSAELDFLGLSLTLLTTWILIFIVVARFGAKNIKGLLFFFKLLLVALAGRFFPTTLILFYFFFEAALIPIFFIILSWGYQSERFLAGLIIFFYTLAASFPLLVTLFLIWHQSSAISFSPTAVTSLSGRSWISLALAGAFLVKFPIYSVHLWLPKAHVEAPVSGSIILAGVLLKLGGYGLYRLYFLTIRRSATAFFIALRVVGGGLLRILCCRATDIKVIIAYSSVVHIALIIFNLLGGANISLEGIWWAMLAHGVVSSGMFAGANIIYECRHSRRLLINKGLLRFRPAFTFLWFILLIINFAGPFTLNLAAEIFLITGALGVRVYAVWPVATLSFFSAAYNLILYASSQQGKPGPLSHLSLSTTPREFNLLLGHIWPAVATLAMLGI